MRKVGALAVMVLALCALGARGADMPVAPTFVIGTPIGSPHTCDKKAIVHEVWSANLPVQYSEKTTNGETVAMYEYDGDGELMTQTFRDDCAPGRPQDRARTISNFDFFITRGYVMANPDPTSPIHLQLDYHFQSWVDPERLGWEVLGPINFYNAEGNLLTTLPFYTIPEPNCRNAQPIAQRFTFDLNKTDITRWWKEVTSIWAQIKSIRVAAVKFVTTGYCN